MSKDNKISIQNSMKASPGSSSNSERDDEVKKSSGSGKTSFGESDDENIENMSGFDTDSDEDNSKNHGEFGSNCTRIFHLKM